MAAAVWAVQQPADKVVFGCDYDDVELLGRAITRSENWYAAGFAAHLFNGAAFGAAYASIGPALPVAPMLRGPLAALVENFAGWPLGAVVDRIHPAREQLPQLQGNRRALIQATWRHLLFGVVLGELERRLNAEPEPTPPAPEPDYSSNGHGPINHVVSVTVADPDE